MERSNFIQAYNIDSGWREALNLCVKNGYDYVVEGGSYVGQIRKQLEHLTLVITDPGTRPLSPILPPSVPAPTTDEKIEKYFCGYILKSSLNYTEEYTYGQYIMSQIDRVVDLLIESGGNTNQATLVIGDVKTTFSPDPPCLRSISFKVVNNKLNMTVYFRSWDIFAGLPENLGGLQLLKEYVLNELPEGYEDGKIIAFSDGAHVYEQYFNLVNCLCAEKIVCS